MYGDVQYYEGDLYDKFKKSSNIGYFGCKLYSNKADTLEQRRVEYIPSIRELYVWNNIMNPKSVLKQECASGGEHIITDIHTQPDTICIFSSHSKDLKCRKGEEK